MIATTRKQQKYDHRLKDVVRASGRIDLARQRGVPESTALLPARTFGTFGASSRVLACNPTRRPRNRVEHRLHTSGGLRHAFTESTPTNIGARIGADLLAAYCHSSHQSAASRVRLVFPPPGQRTPKPRVVRGLWAFGGVVPKCERGDSNPHVHWTLDPKSSASANSATLALNSVSCWVARLAHPAS